MKYKEQLVSDEDFEFLYALKKAAEYDAVCRVFGWNEKTQRRFHQQEWNEAKPVVVLCNDQKVGSYLFMPDEDGYYFGRFFLLPHVQGYGIGSTILKRCLAKAAGKTVSLRYLKGNRVHRLYDRHGFQVTKSDKHFVHMQYKSSLLTR
ncbi:GNAT family N-acetyltransferase [Vibrio nomapromontoriensis]|uniref:GNAT family N-acetyltransferase n=1 Tax=Vibrio nomapromontoriensis TaxID=2910246 RepID=UPI003D0EE438